MNADLAREIGDMSLAQGHVGLDRADFERFPGRSAAGARSCVVFNQGATEHMMQNLFIGKGNLAGSPSLKRITGRDGDFDVATMRVMFGRYGQDEQGQVAQVGGFWLEVEIYGPKARACAQHLRKGARVLVIGEQREYTGHDDDGKEVQVHKIVADDVALQLTRVKSIEFQEAARRPTQEEAQAA